MVCPYHDTSLFTCDRILYQHSLACFDISFIEVRNGKATLSQFFNGDINSWFDVDAYSLVRSHEIYSVHSISFIGLVAVRKTDCDELILVVTSFFAYFSYGHLA